MKASRLNPVAFDLDSFDSSPLKTRAPAQD